MIDLYDVQRWYGAHIPPFGSVGFVSFVSENVQFARYLTKQKTNIVLGNYKTAFMQPNGDINIPNWVFNPEYYSTMSYDWTEELPNNLLSVALLVGFIVHECWHVKKSYRDIPSAFKAARIESNNLRSMCYNLVEDLYIEHDAWTAYSCFLQPLREFFFGEKKFENTKEGYANKFNTLLCWTNPNNRDDDFWQDYSDEIDILQRALIEIDKLHRVFLAEELYQLLKDDVDEDDIPDAVNSYDGTGDTVDAESILSDKITKALAGKEKEEETYYSDLPAAVIKDILQNGGFDTLEADQRFKEFGRILQEIKAFRDIPCVPAKRGTRLMRTRLSHVMTDKRVFSAVAEQKTPEDVEVILLGDGSGSMESIYPKVMAAIKGCFESLVGCRIPCGVFVHTTTSGSNNNTLIWRIVEFNLHHTHANIAERFNRSMGISLLQNVDGVAIDRVCQEFTHRQGKKVLCVLSDGLPAAPGYGGERAREHTKKMINQWRKQGITIVAISLTDGVVRDNDDIYGKEFNLPAHDFNRVLQEFVQRFV